MVEVCGETKLPEKQVSLPSKLKHLACDLKHLMLLRTGNYFSQLYSITDRMNRIPCTNHIIVKFHKLNRHDSTQTLYFHGRYATVALYTVYRMSRNTIGCWQLHISDNRSVNEHKRGSECSVSSSVGIEFIRRISQINISSGIDWIVFRVIFKQSGCLRWITPFFRRLYSLQFGIGSPPEKDDARPPSEAFFPFLRSLKTERAKTWLSAQSFEACMLQRASAEKPNKNLGG